MSLVQWDVAILCSDGETPVWIKDYSGEDVCCPECKGGFIPVRGEITRHHYRHRAESNCSGESAQHWSKKYEIAGYLSEIGTAEVEGAIGPYLADVLFEEEWAFEVVFSNPPSDEKMESLRDRLVIFNFSDDTIWGKKEYAESLEHVVTSLGKAILNGDELGLCSSCREYKFHAGWTSKGGICSQCERSILRDEWRSEIRRSGGINQHDQIIPNIFEAARFDWKVKNRAFVSEEDREEGEVYSARRKVEWINLGMRTSGMGQTINLGKSIKGVWCPESYILGDAFVNQLAREKLERHFSKLVSAAQKHNKWALSSPAKERFHLSNLEFRQYEGHGKFNDPCIDGMYSHILLMPHTDSFGNNLAAQIFTRRWVSTTVPDHWAKVDRIIRAYQNWIWTTCSMHPGGSSLSENPLIPMLVNLEIDSIPLLLTDTTGIEGASAESPLKGYFWKLMHALSSARQIFPQSRHPLLKKLVEQQEKPPS